MEKRSLIGRIFAMFIIVFSISTFAAAQDTKNEEKKNNRPLKITHKPRPGYTEEARKNNIQGTVKLRVTFNADGTIGEIVCVNEDGEEKENLMRFGLVDESIRAAEKIKFEAELVHGWPVIVKKVLTYGFSIY